MMPGSVLLTADAVGGIWTYALDLGGALVQRGVGVTLAVLGPAAGADARAEAEGLGLRVVETGLRPEWLAADADEVREAGHRLAVLARETRADLVHLNHPALAADADFAVPVLAACHSCVASWWEAVRASPLPDEFRWRTALVGRGYRAAGALVAPTQAFAAATERLYDLPIRPSVIYNGRAAAGAPVIGLPFDDAVLTAGRLWDEGKNVAALDRAAARGAGPIRAAGPTRGPHGGTVALPAIELLGSLSDDALRRRMAARPIYAAPALYEPFGLAVLEAAQAGCALVLGDIATFRELWEGAALFVAPRDDEAIAAAIASLRADPCERQRLGEAARTRAVAYGSARFADGIVALYDRLLAPSGRNRAA